MNNLRFLFSAFFGIISVTSCYPQFYTVVKKEKVIVVHSRDEEIREDAAKTQPVNFVTGRKDSALSVPIGHAAVPSDTALHSEPSRPPVWERDSVVAPVIKDNEGETEPSGWKSFFSRIFGKGKKKRETELPDTLSSDLVGDMLFCAPLDTLVLTSGYGYRNDPFTGKRKFHHGADYRTNSENVYVMMPGKITKIGYNKVLGNYVTIEHGDFVVTYAHLHTVAGDKGQLVRAGQSIGISGSTGRSAGEHLHIAIRHRNRSVDPHPLVSYIAKVAKMSSADTASMEPGK